MPTYVYRRADGTTFELFQRITDEPLTKDPETGQSIVRVISGGVGVQFKGSGFYETDYVRKPRSEGSSETSSTAASDSDSPSSTSTEASTTGHSSSDD